MSKIIVKHDRDDKGWIAVKEGAFTGLLNGSVFKTIGEACVVAHSHDPQAEVVVDDRLHSKLDNGIVLTRGDYDPKPVTFKEKKNAAVNKK